MYCMAFTKQVFGRMPWPSEARTLVGSQSTSRAPIYLPSTAADHPWHGLGLIRLLWPACVVIAGTSCCGRRVVAASMASQLRYVGLTPMGLLSEEHVSKMTGVYLDEKTDEIGSVDSES